MSLTKMTMTATMLKRMLNWWPPFFLGPGIRVDHVRDDFRHAKVSLRQTFYNRNYVGTHFGGSLYSMCDPMYMLLLLNILGPRDFIVWDKGARIEYRKPGRGTVTAEFDVPQDLIDSLRSLKPEEKSIFDLAVNVVDSNGDVVAHVVKTQYVKRKTAADNSSRSATITSGGEEEMATEGKAYEPPPSRL